MTDQSPDAVTPAENLDLTGLKCPLPVLRTNKVLRNLNKGDVIQVTADDPASAKDFPVYCETTGHKLLAAEPVDNGRFVFRIRKGG
jgi:tRNA 2-thiouridine synthesizing protein A